MTLWALAFNYWCKHPLWHFLCQWWQPGRLPDTWKSNDALVASLSAGFRGLARNLQCKQKRTWFSFFHPDSLSLSDKVSKVGKLKAGGREIKVTHAADPQGKRLGAHLNVCTIHRSQAGNPAQISLWDMYIFEVSKQQSKGNCRWKEF